MLVGDEHSATVLIGSVAEQRRHPRPFAFVRRTASHDPRVHLLRVLPTT